MKRCFVALASILPAVLLSVSLPATASSSPIKHVVIIVQENRTPDNLFHDPILIARGADIAMAGLGSSGRMIVLRQTSLTQNYDLGHSHPSFLAQYDGGKMDGSSKVGFSCAAGAVNCPCSDYATTHKGYTCPLPNPTFYYVTPSEVAPYFAMAETYTFGDRMFQNNQGPSFPAHQFLISGTSTMGINAPNGNQNLYIAENPPNGTAGKNTSGCAVAAKTRVKLIDTTNPNTSTNETETAYPCAEHRTLIDLLGLAHVTWKYYAPGPTSIWTAPNAIEHLCGPNEVPPNATECISAEWTNNVVQPNNTRILTDISDGKLADVSWVIPSGQASDHPVATDGSGPSWVASIVNAIGNSQYWNDTAIFVTWDDWGGWYDHVKPTPLAGNSYEQGFRVPLIVISPYAKLAYVSHVEHDFGSILHFVEETYGLGTLGYADERADDLSDCFDFKQPPTVFKTIPAPLNAAHFLNDKTAPTDPDDD